MRIVSCPLCHKNMEIVHLGRVEIDKCERCDGVWLDKDELDQLIEQERERIAEVFKLDVEAVSEILNKSLGKIFSK